MKHGGQLPRIAPLQAGMSARQMCGTLTTFLSESTEEATEDP